MSSERKRLISVSMIVVFLFVLMGSVAFAANAPKYVFYFIGDGMGPSQRQAAEYFYKVETKNPEAKLVMNTLPGSALVTTHSANTLITDSAASGTALATGFKTTNGVIGKLPDGTDVKSIAEAARDNGYAVGIATTIRLTHATPAAFFAHNMSRENENEIAIEQLNSGFDYFAGGGFRHFVKKDNELGLKSKRKDDLDLIADFQNKGYITFVGEKERDAFRAFVPEKGNKIMAPLAASGIAYEIDRINSKKTENAEPSLAEMTAKGIELLKAQQKPFFMMVEAGKIDYAAHCNDAAATIWDTLALDDAVAEAYEFYKAHKDETLIIVTADHETGGMAMGISLDSKGYFLKLDELSKVKASTEDALWSVYPEMYKKYENVNERHKAYQAHIAQWFGLTNLTDGEKMRLNQAMAIEDKNQTLPYEEQTNYGYEYTPTMIAVADLVSYRARINWTSYVHTASVVPVSSVGPGADLFNGFMDNIEIPRNLAKAMGIELTLLNDQMSEALLGETVGPNKPYAEKPYL